MLGWVNGLEATVQTALTEGRVESVRGSVVDVRFDSQLPRIHSELRTGPDEQVRIEVLTQLNDHVVRGMR